MHLAVRTIDFDYPLPEELIADRPLPDRAASRMMVIHRDTGLIEHRHFCDLPEYVREGDHFILNDTRVVPARYFSNDGAIEVVRAEVLNPLLWKCMVRPGRKMDGVPANRQADSGRVWSLWIHFRTRDILIV